MWQKSHSCDHSVQPLCSLRYDMKLAPRSTKLIKIPAFGRVSKHWRHWKDGIWLAKKSVKLAEPFVTVTCNFRPKSLINVGFFVGGMLKLDGRRHIFCLFTVGPHTCMVNKHFVLLNEVVKMYEWSATQGTMRSTILTENKLVQSRRIDQGRCPSSLVVGSDVP